MYHVYVTITKLALKISTIQLQISWLHQNFMNVLICMNFLYMQELRSLSNLKSSHVFNLSCSYIKWYGLLPMERCLHVPGKTIAWPPYFLDYLFTVVMLHGSSYMFAKFILTSVFTQFTNTIIS